MSDCGGCLNTHCNTPHGKRAYNFVSDEGGGGSSETELLAFMQWVSRTCPVCEARLKRSVRIHRNQQVRIVLVFEE